MDALERFINVCGVSTVPADLAHSERLVASLIKTTSEIGMSQVAAGASLALLCFCAPERVGDAIRDEVLDEDDLQELALAGMSEARDIVASMEVATRLASLSVWMEDEEIEALLSSIEDETLGSRSAVLRRVEELLMGRMAQ